MSQGLDDYRRRSHADWQETAPRWAGLRDSVEATAEQVREWLVRELAPQPGQTLLELAAGVGETGFEAVEQVGPGGRLISTDFSSAMVDEARRRAAERGLENVEHRVVDAEHIDLADDSVDGVICRFGFMLMADPAAALRETRRVLRDGGRLVLAVWGPPDRNPTFSVIGRTLVGRGHFPPPEPGAPGQFSLASEERLRELLADAGFRDVRVEEVPARFAFESVDDYLGVVSETSRPVAKVLAALSADEHAAVAADVEAAFAPFASDDGYELRGLALCAAASLRLDVKRGEAPDDA